MLNTPDTLSYTQTKLYTCKATTLVRHRPAPSAAVYFYYKRSAARIRFPTGPLRANTTTTVTAAAPLRNKFKGYPYIIAYNRCTMLLLWTSSIIIIHQTLNAEQQTELRSSPR